MALRDDTCDWQDADAIGRLRITDPACGTGTLLMAAAERIRDLAPQADVDESIARALIEQVFTGYDVNLTATHMAATTLGLLSPTTQFRNMKIGRTFLGVDPPTADGDAYLGSLEFLDRQPMLMPWPNATPAVTQVDGGDAMAAAAEPADLVIMNPPFTRDSLRHDQFSREEERKIKDREKALFANKPVHLSNNGGPFLYLGEYLARSDTGAMAVVLPLVGATNYATMGMRQYLAQRFHVDTVVTSHDPERIYFSENTDIGEMLVICRRWPDGKGPKPATRVVNLARNPATPAEAISVAWAIENGTVTTQGYSTMQEWPESRIAAGDWGGVQFLSPYLCERFVELRDGGLFPSVQLGSIADVGPAGQRIRDAFTRSEMPDGEGSGCAVAARHRGYAGHGSAVGYAYCRQATKGTLGTKLLATAGHIVFAAKDASQYGQDTLRQFGHAGVGFVVGALPVHYCRAGQRGFGKSIVRVSELVNRHIGAAGQPHQQDTVVSAFLPGRLAKVGCAGFRGVGRCCGSESGVGLRRSRGGYAAAPAAAGRRPGAAGVGRGGGGGAGPRWRNRSKRPPADGDGAVGNGAAVWGLARGGRLQSQPDQRC